MAAKPLRRIMGNDFTVPDEHQIVATLSFIHGMAGDHQGRPAFGKPVKELPQLFTKHGVKTDGWFIENHQPGRTDKRDSQ
jgi:hypothetical protein